MALSLYNTLGRKIEPFQSLVPGKVGFYGCGPTVYNYAHIGNLRAYVTHDILVRALRRAGYDAVHVMNVTDVGHLTGDDDSGDDKMVKSAEERGKSVLEIAAFYTEAFFKDTARLNIQKPTVVCKATEHIGDMIGLISRIEAKGYTYTAGGNLYFDITKFPTYGDFARLALDDGKTESRVVHDGNKKNPFDFALWFTKSKFGNQALVWDSPWGRGYPGWHIECSAMSMKYLGEQFDIHAGGIDHVAIHHTNEIAQSEAATGKQWVRYWVHNEFLVMDKGKMSKSSGSFLTLQTLVDAGYSPMDYRYLLLGGHYRTQLQFSFESLEGAKNARKSLLDRLGNLREKAKPESLEALVLGSQAQAHMDAFNRAIDEDLSTPRGLAELWGLIRDPEVSPEEALFVCADMDRILGLALMEDSQKSRKVDAVDAELAAEIEALVAKRKDAKKNRDFPEADRIRDTLRDRGILLEDGPAGTTWRRLS